MKGAEKQMATLKKRRKGIDAHRILAIASSVGFYRIQPNKGSMHITFFEILSSLLKAVGLLRLASLEATGHDPPWFSSTPGSHNNLCILETIKGVLW